MENDRQETSAQHPSVRNVAILSAVLGGCNTPRRIRAHFRLAEKAAENRIRSLRRAGLLKVFRGGRDFTLEVTEDGKRVVTGFVHGLRSLTVQKVERRE